MGSNCILIWLVVKSFYLSAAYAKVGWLLENAAANVDYVLKVKYGVIWSLYGVNMVLFERDNPSLTPSVDPGLLGVQRWPDDRCFCINWPSPGIIQMASFGPTRTGFDGQHGEYLYRIFILQQPGLTRGIKGPWDDQYTWPSTDLCPIYVKKVFHIQEEYLYRIENLWWKEWRKVIRKITICLGLGKDES